MLAPALVDLAERSIQANQPLVLCGEIGVGKTTFANRLLADVRRSGSQVTYLDGTIDHCDARSMLHQLRDAEHSIIVIDRVELLSIQVQNQLLSLLDDRNLQNCRGMIVTITTRNIAALVEERVLSAALAQRLDGTTLIFPPLRDAPMLPEIVLRAFAMASTGCGQAELAVSSEALTALTSHHWPGNLHELKNVVRHAALISKDIVQLGDLPPHVVTKWRDFNLKARSQREAARIEAALQQHRGNVSATAKYLGVSRATLYRKYPMRGARSRLGGEMTSHRPDLKNGAELLWPSLRSDH